MELWVVGFHSQEQKRLHYILDSRAVASPPRQNDLFSDARR